MLYEVITNSREPLSAALDLKRSEQYGVSMFRNFLLSSLHTVTFIYSHTLRFGPSQTLSTVRNNFV